MKTVRIAYLVLGVLGIFSGIMEALVYDGRVPLIMGVMGIVGGLLYLGTAMVVAEVEALRERVRQLEQPVPALLDAPANPVVVALTLSPEEQRDLEEVQSLLRSAQGIHFQRRFEEARRLYSELIARFPATKQASVARQQLENLRGV